MATRYPSKVDAWLAIVMVVALVAILLGVYAALREGHLWAALVGVGTVGLVGALCWPTDYTLYKDEIVVRSGLIRYRIPYPSITQMSPSRAMWSAPAWSLDRLLIVYGKRWMLVSPVDAESFMAEVASRDAGLVYRDGVVVRELT